jgi:hypothetical protein
VATVKYQVQRNVMMDQEAVTYARLFVRLRPVAMVMYTVTKSVTMVALMAQMQHATATVSKQSAAMGWYKRSLVKSVTRKTQVSAPRYAKTQRVATGYGKVESNVMMGRLAVPSATSIARLLFVVMVSNSQAKSVMMVSIIMIVLVNAPLIVGVPDVVIV